MFFVDVYSGRIAFGLVCYLTELHYRNRTYSDSGRETSTFRMTIIMIAVFFWNMVQPESRTKSGVHDRQREFTRIFLA
jgi:hypothetical protein